MTQVYPEPARPAPDTTLDVPDTEDFTHITLHQAARDGNIDVIKQRLQKLERNSARRLKVINKADQDKMTPLHYAARFGHVEILKLLIEDGEVDDIPGENGASLLHYAARFGANLACPSASRQVSQAVSDGADGGIEGVDAASTEDESVIAFLLNTANADVNICDRYGMTPLHYAASKGNLMAVTKLLQFEGIKVDAVDKSGCTALHCTATKGKREIIEALLKADADPTKEDREKMTPIHFACRGGNLEAVKLLFEHAEKTQTRNNMLESQNEDGETALHVAVKGGYTDVVKMCLEKEANVNSQRANRAHPLHIAAINGYVKIAELLVNCNAQIEARNANQETPLHKAAAFNKDKMVKFLLEKGADIDCIDKDSYTPLLVAASEGHTAVVKFLLEKGADLKATERHDRTIIFLAAEKNRVDTLKEILGHPDAEHLINKGDHHEDTPLHVAAMNDNALVVETLLSHAAVIHAKNEEGNTPLHLAAKNGRIRTVNALIKKDSSTINDEDESSNTPLHLAATGGHEKCCKALLEQGADVDARNSFLWTPLDCAAAKGHTEVASLLLEFGSPVDPIDKAKTTPLHLAAKEGHADMVSFLLSKGADITLTDQTGRNCLDLAADHGHREAALAIINDDNWMAAMRNMTLEQNHVTTPLRKLIIKLPEVAKVVFNHCITNNGLPIEEEKYEITLNYEFLEDVYVKWSDNDDGADSETANQGSFSMGVDAENDQFQKIHGKAAQSEVIAQLAKKNYHPLMIMVQNQQEQLLAHPLVTFLLNYKWQTFGRYVYYFKLSLYCLFIFFLTGYTVYSTENAAVCVNGTNTRPDIVDEDSVPFVLWVKVGRIVILALASCHILSELYQLLNQFKQYFSWENLLEWSVYVLAIVYVTDEFDLPLVSSCTTEKRTIGAFSIFLAWMGLVLFIRKFPMLGIYIVMFTSVLYTFMKFFIIFVLFLIAFALSFYTLLHDPQQTVSSFGAPGRAFVKTGVMMIGEFDFDDLFNSPDIAVPGITWLIFIVFVIVMTLILMNLLIGLAVDDIKGVQEQAVLERQAMLVDLAMHVEKALPRFLQERFAPDKQTILPNQYHGFKRYWYSLPISSAKDIQAALTPKRGPLVRLKEEIQETVTGLKNRMQTMEYNQKEIHKMLHEIAKTLEVNVEKDDDKDR